MVVLVPNSAEPYPVVKVRLQLALILKVTEATEFRSR